MADRVTIEFGAKVDDLIKGVSAVRGQLEGLRSNVSTVGSVVTSLTAGFASAFSVAALVNFTTKMADLGQRTEDLAQRLGVSNDAIHTFSGLARLSGDTVDSVVSSMERMSLSVQRGAKDSFSQQAQALKVLGLSAKELIGIQADKYFEKVADAVSKLEPSLNRTNAVMALGGRGMAQLIPILAQGGEAYKKITASIKQAQDGLAAATPLMSDTYTKIALLSISAQSLGARIFTVLKPAIDLVVTSLTNWFQKLDAKTIQEFARAITTQLSEAIIWSITLFHRLGTSIDEVIGKLKTLLAGAAIGGAIGLVGGPGGAALGALGGAGIAAAWDMWKEQFNTGADDAKSSAEEKLNTLVKTIRDGAKALSDAMGGLGGAAGGGGGGGNKAAAMDLGARSSFDAKIAAIQGEIAIRNEQFQQQAAIYQRDADLFASTEQEKLSRLKQASEARFAFERESLERIRDMQRSAGLDKEAEQTNQRILLLDQQLATERIRIYADMARDIKAKWDEVFGAFQSSFNGQLRGLLAGTTSFKNAFRSILGDMIIFFIQMVEKMVFQWIAGQLAMVGISQTAEAAKTAVASEGAAARTAIQIPEIVKAIFADLGKMFASLSAWLTPAIGPAAPAAAAGVVAGAQATALGFVGAFEVGTDYVPRTGFAMVHEGERIVTATDNKRGGGSSVSIGIQAIDTQSGAMFLRKNARNIGKAISQELRRRNGISQSLTNVGSIR